MTDATLTDLAPFFERYDRRQRLVFVAALAASLALSAVILTQAAIGAPGAKLPANVSASLWVLGVAFTPLFIVGWWAYTEHMARARRRGALPDGRHPVGADDALNGVQLANRGFVFNLVVMAAVVVQQAMMALMVSGYSTGNLIPRGTMVAVGAVAIYLGNFWPRMPTPRVPERAAAARMRANRFSGWVMVIFGLLVILLGLFLPLIHPAAQGLHRP